MSKYIGFMLLIAFRQQLTPRLTWHSTSTRLVLIKLYTCWAGTIDCVTHFLSKDKTGFTF